MNTKRTLIILLCTALIFGCTEKDQPLSANEVKDFSRVLEISIGKRDPVFLDNSLDKKELMRRAGIPYRNSESKSMNFGKKLIDALSRKGEFVLVKQYEKQSAWHILYRAYDPQNGGINYYDMELFRSKGEIKIADAYAYNIGQSFSELFKELNQQMDEIEDKSGENKDKWLDKVGPMRKLAAEGRAAEAMEIFQTIPPDVRKTKMMQIIHVMISIGIDPETHQEAMQEYKSMYPNEPNIALLQVSTYLLLENYELALPAIDELDKIIDKDPFLDYYRGLCYRMLKQPEKQIEALLRLTKSLPDFEEGKLELINAYLTTKEHDKARVFIKDFRTRGSFDQSTLDLILSLHLDFEE